MHQFEDLLSKTANLLSKVMEHALQIIVVLLIGFMVFTLLRWAIRKHRGIVILSFDTPGATDKDDSGNCDGKSIANLLQAELWNILQIRHRRYSRLNLRQPPSSRPSSSSAYRTLPRKKENSEQPFEPNSGKPTRSLTVPLVDRPSDPVLRGESGVNARRRGTDFFLNSHHALISQQNMDSVQVKVSGVNVSLGQLLLSIKQLWTSNDPLVVISGSFQRFGDQMYLIACLEHKKYKKYPSIFCSTPKSEYKGANELPKLIRELAYEIWHQISVQWPNIGLTGAETSQGFQWYIKAVASFQEYQSTGNTNALEEAGVQCLEAAKAEPNFVELFNLSVCLANAFVAKGDFTNAEELCNCAIETSSLLRTKYEFNVQLYHKFGLLPKRITATHLKISLPIIRAKYKLKRIKKQYSEDYEFLSTLVANFGPFQTDPAIIKRWQDIILEAGQVELLNMEDVELGKLYANLNLRDEAIVRFKKALDDKNATRIKTALENKTTSKNIEEVDLHIFLGNLHLDCLKLNDAIKHYEAALKLLEKDKADDPRIPSLYNWLGIAIMYEYESDEAKKIICIDKRKKAIEKYEKAISEASRLKIPYADPHNNLGYMYRQDKDPNKAIKAYEKAIELEPGLSVAYNNLGLLFRANGQLDEAEDYLRQGTKNRPSVDLYNALGEVLYRKNSIIDAIKAFEEALMHDPNCVLTHDWLGYIHMQRKEWSAALAKMQHVVDLLPTYRRGHAALAVCYEKLDQVAEYKRQRRVCGRLLKQDYEEEYLEASFEALLGNAGRAVDLLKTAIDKHQRPFNYVNRDSDFNKILKNSEFIKLMKEFKKSNDNQHM